ncbi:RING-H2 zinc finger [Carpediemonas membranifera]|uniref:RING-H2 zinc finger n=1 Tax=Carpediemonas membranifera TaxID=201153 RepID=A0A8J6AZW5_9EUKA|nr:RING-H2 zinc finger [Carpediemonas membranifera]|eukprot:KAG9396320.1 RING-H2 zinc finger [Carpediemonas membranifera]
MSEAAETKPRVKLLKYNAVAMWRYTFHNEKCGICRTHITQRCLDCVSAGNDVSECKLAWGRCGHCFHVHCIQKWLKTTHTCPMCSQVWEAERITGHNAADEDDSDDEM